MMRQWIVTTTKKLMDYSWNFGFKTWRVAAVAALAVSMAWLSATGHDMSDDDEIKTEDELKGLTAFGSNDNVRTAFGSSDVPSSQRHEPERIFTSVEQNPEFPGGQAGLLRFLSENIIYPAEAAENGKEGRVVVQFVVEKDGSVGEVKVVRGVDPALDAEAVRVCKSLPHFKPGRQNGKPVRVWFTLPVTFKLRVDDTESTTAFGSSGPAPNDVETLAYYMNRICPYKTQFGTCTRAKIDGKYFALETIVNNSIVNLEALSRDKAEFSKILLDFLIANERMSGKPLFSILVENGYGYRSTYNDFLNDRQFVLEVSCEELDYALRHPTSLEELLVSRTKVSKTLLPMKIDNATTLVDINIGSELFYYIFEIDDSSFNFDTMLGMKDKMKETVTESIALAKDDPIAVDYKFIARSGRGLRQIFNGRHSCKSLIIDINNSELRDLLQDYSTGLD